MFSREFDEEGIRRILDEGGRRGADVALDARGPSIDLEKAATLVWSQGEDRERVIRVAEERRQVRWDGQLFLMPPLYISNGQEATGGCADECLYCNWRRGSLTQEQIVRLSDEEVASAVARLVAIGYRDVELVAATDRKLYDAGRVASVVGAARQALGPGGNVGINFFPLPTPAHYARVCDKGCTFSIVWQETYAKATYARLHPAGPKSNMAYRLDAHDRAIEGGIPTVGLGFLGHLDDWRYDFLATVAHATYLRRREPGVNLIFGLPRWKDGPAVESSVKRDAREFDEHAYRLVAALYSLAFPDALPWYSSREGFPVSYAVARGGGSLFTLDCSTAVGYDPEGVPQFQVNSKPYREGCPELVEHGFKLRHHLPWPVSDPHRPAAGAVRT